MGGLRVFGGGVNGSRKVCIGDASCGDMAHESASGSSPGYLGERVAVANRALRQTRQTSEGGIVASVASAGASDDTTRVGTDNMATASLAVSHEAPGKNSAH